MSAFSKAYTATFFTIFAIIAWLEGAPIALTQFKQLAQLTFANYAAIIGAILSFFLLNLVVYFGFLSCCFVGVMVCCANFFISEYVLGPSIIEYWWLMVIPGVLYGIVFSAMYFGYNNGFKNR